MAMIVLGILFIIAGIFMLLKRNDKNKLYNRLKNGKADDYEETIGTVICDAYKMSEGADGDSFYKMITPIVEYEVNGEKYEGQNEQLSPNGELPVGTKMKVWYRKDNPQDYVLQTELRSYNNWIFYGIICIAVGCIIICIKLF